MTTQAFNLSQFANFVNSSGQVSASGIQSGVVVASGTVMLFYQSAAPTGWTQVTSLNDYAMRLVSGSGGSTGGTTAFSTVFSNQSPSVSVSVSGTVGGTTLALSQIAGHAHNYTSFGGSYYGPAGLPNDYGGLGSNASVTDYQGGGGSHSHSFSGSGSGSSSAVVLNVRYANIIICSKN